MSKTDEVKVYHPEEIDDNPLPNQQGEVIPAAANPSDSTVKNPTRVRNEDFPGKRVAVELLSSAMNTKSRKILAEFEFAGSGALQIGKYQAGTSGDIRITPTGIVGRNTSGINTFNLDGEDGSATFLGEIRGGSLVSGEVVVGNNRVVIDGDNARMLVYDDNGVPVGLFGFHQNGF